MRVRWLRHLGQTSGAYCTNNQRFKACARSDRANTSLFVSLAFLHGLVRNTRKQKRSLVLALSVGWATVVGRGGLRTNATRRRRAS